VSTNVDTGSLVRYYQDYSNKIVKSKGKLEGAKFLKSLYGLALRHASRVEYKALSFIRSDKGGFPRVLKPFRKLLDGSPDDKRAALTVLQLFKLLEVKGEARIDSIVNPYTGDTNPSWIETFKEVVLEEFPPSEISERVSKLKGSLFISGKNGPNGPAMTTCHIDYVSIAGSDLDRNIQMLAELTLNDQLASMISNVRCACDYEVKHPKRIPTHSRLRIKYEPGGKARVFAILDLFSQSALKPIHEFLMSWLKSKEEDGTNDHSFAAKQLKIWTQSHNPIWSFDLTTATDRYPVFLQEIVIKACFGDEIADLWKKIITDREFLSPDGTKSVRFSVGQPLGA
jgi:hypothetical protein